MVKKKKKKKRANRMVKSRSALYRFFILRAISEYRPVSNFLYLLTYFVASFVRNGVVSKPMTECINKLVHVVEKTLRRSVDRFGISRE